MHLLKTNFLWGSLSNFPRRCITSSYLSLVVIVSCITRLCQEGVCLGDSIVRACEHRLRPVLITASITVFSLIPLLFVQGPGSEVQRPLAVVVVGELITSTLLTILVLPILYSWFERKRGALHNHEGTQ